MSSEYSVAQVNIFIYQVQTICKQLQLIILLILSLSNCAHCLHYCGIAQYTGLVLNGIINKTIKFI